MTAQSATAEGDGPAGATGHGLAAERDGADRPPARAIQPQQVLDQLDAGVLRAAYPDPAAPGGWRVDPTVKTAIIGRFADRRIRRWTAGAALRFRDRVGLPVKDLDAGQRDRPDSNGTVRVVPGGTSIRAGVFLGNGVVIMPPAFINVGAWVGDETMIDSHVLVGSCAQIGARVHLAAGVQIGGVLEPPAARPVIVEDDAFIGAGSILLDGILVGAGAVIGAGVTLTGTSRLYDAVRGRVLDGMPDAPLVVPPRAVVVPGARIVETPFGREHGLSLATALIVKDRDCRTDARTALEAALR